MSLINLVQNRPEKAQPRMTNLKRGETFKFPDGNGEIHMIIDSLDDSDPVGFVSLNTGSIGSLSGRLSQEVICVSVTAAWELE